MLYHTGYSYFEPEGKTAAVDMSTIELHCTVLVVVDHIVDLGTAVKAADIDSAVNIDSVVDHSHSLHQLLTLPY